MISPSKKNRPSLNLTAKNEDSKVKIEDQKQEDKKPMFLKNLSVPKGKLVSGK